MSAYRDGLASSIEAVARARAEIERRWPNALFEVPFLPGELRREIEGLLARLRRPITTVGEARDALQAGHELERALDATCAFVRLDGELPSIKRRRRMNRRAFAAMFALGFVVVTAVEDRAKAAACATSEWCRLWGECAPAEHGCVPASDEDCARSEDCTRHGRCSYEPALGRCWIGGDGDCRLTSGCRERGKCSRFFSEMVAFGAECRVAGDEDCARGAACAEERKCHDRGGACDVSPAAP